MILFLHLRLSIFENWLAVCKYVRHIIFIFTNIWESEGKNSLFMYIHNDYNQLMRSIQNILKMHYVPFCIALSHLNFHFLGSLKVLWIGKVTNPLIWRSFGAKMLIALPRSYSTDYSMGIWLNSSSDSDSSLCISSLITGRQPLPKPVLPGTPLPLHLLSNIRMCKI